MKIEARIKKLGLELPNYSSPVASYIPVVHVGDLLFLSGHLAPKQGTDKNVTGKLGKDLTEEEGYKISIDVALNLLSTIKHEMGDLDKVKRIIKILGFVNSAKGFNRQPWVINGASEILVKIFGWILRV